MPSPSTRSPLAGEGGPATIMETLNPHLTSTYSSSPLQDMDMDSEADVKPAKNTSRVALAVGTDPRAWSYRYMFERPGMKGHGEHAIASLRGLFGLCPYAFPLSQPSMKQLKSSLRSCSRHTVSLSMTLPTLVSCRRRLSTW